MSEMLHTLGRRVRALRYHRAHAVMATRVLKAVERQRGTISRTQIAQCDQYAIETLGSKSYAPWLYVYAALSGGFREGWIPDNYYGAVVSPQLKGSHGAISGLKSMSGRVFDSQKFPDVAYSINGKLLDTSYRVLSDNQQIMGALFGSGDQIIFKMDHSSRGDGVRFFDKKTWSSVCLSALGNGVFQQKIVQHPLFASFGSSAVATLRLTTLADTTGQVTLRAAYVRLGANGDLQVMSASHIRVPVDLKSGRLDTLGYLSDWTTTVGHPASGKCFANESIPSRRQSIDAVIALHQKVPFVACIGWDVAINEQGGVEIMEWNGEHNDIKFSEATQGPCFVDQHWERLPGV